MCLCTELGQHLADNRNLHVRLSVTCINKLWTMRKLYSKHQIYYKQIRFRSYSCPRFQYFVNIQCNNRGQRSGQTITGICRFVPVCEEEWYLGHMLKQNWHRTACKSELSLHCCAKFISNWVGNKEVNEHCMPVPTLGQGYDSTSTFCSKTAKLKGSELSHSVLPFDSW